MVDMIQGTTDQDTMGRGCTWPKQYVWIHLNHVHRYMCDTGMAKLSVSVMTPRALVTAWQRRRLEAMTRCTTRCGMFGHSCCSVVRNCGNVVGGGGVNSSGVPADPVCPLDVGLKSGERAGQGTVRNSRPTGATYGVRLSCWNCVCACVCVCVCVYCISVRVLWV